MKKTQTPRPIAQSTTNKPKPFAQLQLHQETIAGRKVVLVVANVDSDAQHDCFADLASRCLPRVKLSPISWPEFLNGLPALEADLIFICSTRYGPDDFDALKTGLRAFRSRNPEAVVAMANTHLGHTFHSNKLIDHIEHHDTFSIPFLLKGVELFVRKQDLQ